MPVLGQAIEIQLNSSPINWGEFPAVLSINNLNLIPIEHNKLIIGATIEQGINPKVENLKDLQEIRYRFDKIRVKNSNSLIYKLITNEK